MTQFGYDAEDEAALQRRILTRKVRRRIIASNADALFRSIRNRRAHGVGGASAQAPVSFGYLEVKEGQ